MHAQHREVNMMLIALAVLFGGVLGFTMVSASYVISQRK